MTESGIIGLPLDVCLVYTWCCFTVFRTLYYCMWSGGHHIEFQVALDLGATKEERDDWCPSSITDLRFLSIYHRLEVFICSS